jgi:16S rRNA C1402 (ribose-2'-O) methylase RsmI
VSQIQNLIGERKLKGEITLVVEGKTRKQKGIGRHGDAEIE